MTILNKEEQIEQLDDWLSEEIVVSSELKEGLAKAIYALEFYSNQKNGAKALKVFNEIKHLVDYNLYENNSSGSK